MNHESKKKRIVILGTGFASFSFLKHVKTSLYEIIVVSPRNHFLFSPLLPSTTVGTIEFRSIIEPIRFSKLGFKFYQASCEKIFSEDNNIQCKVSFGEDQFELFYDYLIVGVGAQVNTFGVKGVKEHALFLKELWDARKIRQNIIKNLEKASAPNLTDEDRKKLLHFVVVGGGATGVEFAAELNDFLNEDLSKWFEHLVPFIKITLLEATDKILGTFDEALREYALKLFYRKNIDVKFGSAVTEVKKNQVILANGTSIDFGILVWSGGIAPIEMMKDLDFKKSKSGMLLTNEYCELIEKTNIFCLGDCAEIEGQNIPTTAQAAQQQGKYLARQFNRKLKKKKMQSFKYNNLGMLAYVGSRKALANINNRTYSGLGTWLLWRSAYLTKLVSLKNKVLVLFDWFKKTLFGRDISRF